MLPKKEFTQQMQADIESVNNDLLYLIDLLTPMEGQYRTAQEQVYFEIALSAVSKLPINNNSDIVKYK